MKLQQLKETIVAPITGINKSAVAIIRISGPDAISISQKIFHPWPENFEFRKAYYGNFSNGDDGILLCFKKNSSFTGDETAEWNIHGSIASIQSILEEACNYGARIAKPGEFTMRAFLNGKLDLTQAEGIRDSIESNTEYQFKLASQLRKGTLQKEISHIKKRLLSTLGMVEATTDFSEEIGYLNSEQAFSLLSAAKNSLMILLQRKQTSELIKRGIRIALVGRPNAGKSSILNRCLGRERSIVTEIAGTTRDTIEETLDINGIPCILVDTAGLRTASDIVEQIGVNRAKEETHNADIVWYIYDASVGWQEEDSNAYDTIQSRKEIVANKCDVSSTQKGIPVSAKNGTGFDNLFTTIKDLVGEIDTTSQTYINKRHTVLLENILNSVNHAMYTLEHNLPSDLLAVDLQSGIRNCNEILGVEIHPDIVEEIFSEFCIGK